MATATNIVLADQGGWADDRETQFNAEVHNLLDAAADAIDGDGSPLECIDATRAAISVIDARLINERAYRLGPDEGNAGNTNEIEDRIEKIRGQIFDAQAVVDVVRMSIDSSEDFSRHHALQNVYDQLDGIATQLQYIAGDVRKLENAPLPK